MFATWMLRGWHVLMLLVLYAAWWGPISRLSERTHGFQGRTMTGGEIIGSIVVLMIVLWVWAKGGKIIKSFR